MPAQLPNDSQHLFILGATGTGKTQAAQWHLSHRNFHVMPWVVYNFKEDPSIDAIPGSVPIGVNEMPEKPGIYIAHPLPGEEDEVERQMWEIWKKQNTGVYVDEGYMLGRNNPAFRALATQGRSRHNPLIVLSQRPVFMDRFAVSEASFYQIFRLNHKGDRAVAQEFIPREKINLDNRLPKYHSYYYDVGNDAGGPLGPVPAIRTIHSTFARRFEPRGRRVV